MKNFYSLIYQNLYIGKKELYNHERENITYLMPASKFQSNPTNKTKMSFITKLVCLINYKYHFLLYSNVQRTYSLGFYTRNNN